MTRIPEATPQGRPGFGQARRITSDQSGEMRANALIAVGEAIDAHQEKQDNFNYSLAKSSFLTADIESRKSLEEDPDWETWEERHAENMQKALDGATGKIRDKRDRALFEMEAKLDMERSLHEVRKLATARKVDAGRADLSSSLDAMLRASAETDDPGTRRQMVQTANAMIASAANADIPLVSEQEAEAMRKEWTEQYAVQSVALMSDEDQMAVLKEPEGTAAQFLHPSVRQDMFRKAESRNKTKKITQSAINNTEQVMSQFPTIEDRKDALQWISDNVDDPEAQVATRNMVNGRYAEMSQIEAQAKAESLELVADAVENGSSIEQVRQTEQWTQLSMQERRNAEVRYRQVQEGLEPIHNDKAYYEWTQLSQQEQLATDTWSKYRHRVDDRHWEAIQSRQRALLDAKEGSVAAQQVIRDGNTQSQMIEDALLTSGIFNKKPTAGQAANARRWAKVEDTINRRVQMAAEAKGKKLSSSEVQQIIDEEVIKRAFVSSLFTDDEKFIVNMTEKELSKAYTKYEDIPTDDLELLSNYARSIGVTPPNFVLERAHAAWLAGDYQRAMTIIRESE